MKVEESVRNLLQIYMSLDPIDKQMFKLIEQSVDESNGLKLVVTPTLDLSDGQNMSSHSSDISVTQEVINYMHLKVTFN